MRDAVESLLAAEESAGDFLAGPTDGGRAATGNEASLGFARQQIGPYKLLQVIGEGGFGTVYLAEQERPVRRRVALKLIKLGMDTAEVIARFEAERQALAMMDHPHIAHVFDAGATENGRPYFVMELVRGVPIAEYCDRQRLDIPRRLQLFALVCAAVQHAHTKGIIHRDLKPSNVLVSTQDDRPMPKIIDFGIAKATQSRLTDRTLFTEYHQFIGSPAYMSPEQAEGSLDIDTRSDVYSLGTMLYELLTGSTPLDMRELRSKTHSEIQETIREVDPPKPSTRLNSMKDALAKIAEHRAVSASKLGPIVRGELDWICMKAMEKDRARRYETAGALAVDIEHYLSDEPVSAVKPSQTYLLRKFAKRNRTIVFAGTAVFVTLLVGVIGTSIALVGQARERALAQGARATAEAVSQFQADLLASADPDKSLGKRVTVWDVMNSAVRELDNGKLKEQPAVEAAVRVTIGSTFRALGQFDAAEPNLKKAVELYRTRGTRSGLGLAAGLSNLGLNYYEQGRLDAAEPLYKEAIGLKRAAAVVDKTDLAHDVNNLGMLYSALGRYVEARPLFDEALSLYRNAQPPDIGSTSIALNNLALLLVRQGKPADAEPIYREALAIDRQLLPPGHPKIAVKLCNLSDVLETLGKYDESESLAREGLAIFRSTLPAGHTNIAKALIMVAASVSAKGNLEEAERLHRESLEIHRASLPPDHPDIATSLLNVGSIARRRNNLPEAERMFREALAIYRRTLPPDHPYVSEAANSLADVLIGQNKPAEAEPMLREAMSALDHSMGPNTNQASRARYLLGLSLAKMGRFAEAEAMLLQAHAAMSTAQGISASSKARCVRAITQLYTDWNAAEPGKGYDAKSAEWNARLPATSATSRPL